MTPSLLTRMSLFSEIKIIGFSNWLLGQCLHIFSFFWMASLSELTLLVLAVFCCCTGHLHPSPGWLSSKKYWINLTKSAIIFQLGWGDMKKSSPTPAPCIGDNIKFSYPIFLSLKILFLLFKIGYMKTWIFTILRLLLSFTLYSSSLWQLPGPCSLRSVSFAFFTESLFSHYRLCSISRVQPFPRKFLMVQSSLIKFSRKKNLLQLLYLHPRV